MSINRSKTRQSRFWNKWRLSGAICSNHFDQQSHPEILAGEVWVSNSDDELFNEMRWKSRRAGVIAYNSYGKQLTQQECPGMFPVFALKSELSAAGITIK